MSTIAGYTICFTAEGQLRQITVAERDDDAIDRMLRDRFGAVRVLSRMALDSRD
jgi:Zn-finger domain-containing protein